jgi:hypothetical protein
MANSIRYIGEALGAAYQKLAQSRWLYIIELTALIIWLLAMIFDF